MGTRDEVIRIVPVGGCGAGKTAFVKALSDSSSADFTVKPAGEESSAYLRSREIRDLPAQKVGLVVSGKGIGGRSVRIDYAEYDGRDIQDAHSKSAIDSGRLDALLKGQDVAILLFNPQIEKADAEAIRRDYLAWIGKIEKSRCRAAFAVTGRNEDANAKQLARDLYEELTKALGPRVIGREPYRVAVIGTPSEAEEGSVRRLIGDVVRTVRKKKGISPWLPVGIVAVVAVIALMLVRKWPEAEVRPPSPPVAATPSKPSREQPSAPSQDENWTPRERADAARLQSEFERSPILSAYSGYQAFFSAHPKNPAIVGDLPWLKNAACNRIKKEFGKYRAVYKKDFESDDGLPALRLEGKETADCDERLKAAKAAFDEFRSLCIAVADDNGSLSGSDVLAFAKDCRSGVLKGFDEAFLQTLEVEGASVSITNLIVGKEHVGFFKNLDVTLRLVQNGKDGDEKVGSLLQATRMFGDGDFCGDMPLVTNAVSAVCHHWQNVRLVCDCTLYDGINAEAGTFWTVTPPCFRDGVAAFEWTAQFVPRTFGVKVAHTRACRVKIRLRGRIVGEGFAELWRRHFGE